MKDLENRPAAVRESSGVAVTTRNVMSHKLWTSLGLLALLAAIVVVARPFLVKGRRIHAQQVSAVTSQADKLVERGVEVAQQRRWLEAVEIFDSALRTGADTVLVHRGLGRALGELGWIEDAIHEYETAIAKDPSYFNTYINLATAYRSI